VHDVGDDRHEKEEHQTIAAVRFTHVGHALSSTNTATSKVAKEYSRAARCAMAAWSAELYAWRHGIVSEPAHTRASRPVSTP
jgi:hypothetical protein